MPAHRLYVARELGSGSLIGFCSCFDVCDDTGPRLELDLLAVLPAARGKGLATRMLKRALEGAEQRGVTRARATVRTGNRASERAFGQAGLAPSTPSCELLVYAPQGDHPIAYLPQGWSDSLAGDKPPGLGGSHHAAAPESYVAHDYALTDADAVIRGQASVVPVHTLSGWALWIERLQVSCAECAATAARGIVERAKQWGIGEIGFLAPQDSARQPVLTALIAEGFEGLGRFRVYERAEAPPDANT
jgi:GNAT superfamily N-acetyltransferase